MEAQHTKGPWVWVADDWNGGFSGLVASETNEEVLFPNHKNEGDEGAAWFDDFPSEANAHLIAAAPELLEALDMIEKSISGGGRVVTFSDLDIKEIQTAIAKAKGES